MSKYNIIVKHYENCFARHGDTYRGVDWTNQEDVYTRFRIMLEVISEPVKPVTLLDFGCGTSHLFEYILKNNFSNITYTGLDLSEKFIEASKAKYPQNEYFKIDLIKTPDQIPVFDYIVMNGVLTEKRELSFDQMWEYAQELLTKVFNKCKYGVAFNVMAKAVDWERDDLFHLPMDTLASFLVKNITRNFMIRNDYGLYEYTTYIYK